ncbi:hypothetical protein BBJ29_007215 [Phytophthora kernoviae]|uniref:Uncharacterized protein n=1 Tax=Phytophthora kernoviae TaxID=325452 RepID=A0A3F2RI31_9STRA|nr:hypothetical protein BBP00_00008211 [Phytophthora kernoviae]RLN62845.1 hypothetical protein BBJ29_007215 [Phytophthora kernoviae]
MAKTGEAEQERRAVELDVAASQVRTEPVKALAMSTDVSPSPTMLETRFLLFFSAQDVVDDEQQLLSAFLTTCSASQRSLTQKLLVSASVSDFPRLLQFLLRVMMAAHALSHDKFSDDCSPQTDEPSELEASSCCCSTQNTLEDCISYEKEENGGATGVSVVFKLPESFHSCLATHYGSVKRLKCEESVQMLVRGLLRLWRPFGVEAGGVL